MISSNQIDQIASLITEDPDVFRPSGDPLERNVGLFEKHFLNSVDSLEKNKIKRLIDLVRSGKDYILVRSEIPKLDLEPKSQKELHDFLLALQKINDASPEQLKREGLPPSYREGRLDRARRIIDHLINQRSTYDRESADQTINDPKNFRWRRA